jgi:hypothetical protein
MNVPFKSFGVQLAPESPGEHGMKFLPSEARFMLKIHAPNSGVDTEVRSLLFSMNFAEELTLRTCSDGSIVTQSAWKLKAVQSPWLEPTGGSPLISTQEIGILNAMSPHA